MGSNGSFSAGGRRRIAGRRPREHCGAPAAARTAGGTGEEKAHWAGASDEPQETKDSVLAEAHWLSIPHSCGCGVGNLYGKTRFQYRSRSPPCLWRDHKPGAQAHAHDPARSDACHLHGPGRNTRVRRDLRNKPN